MKTRYIIAAAIMLAALVSCNKEPGIASQGEPIRFDAGVATRADIGDATALQAKTLKIVDVLKVNSSNFIDDVLTYDSSKGWTAQNGPYYWTAGNHLFISYLNDATAFGSVPALNENNQLVLTKTTTISDDVDFIYADKVAITQTESAPNKEPASPVELSFHHLFSAVKFHIVNNLAQQVTVNSLTLNGIKTNMTATVSYTTDATTITYEDGASQTALAWEPGAVTANGGTADCGTYVWEQAIAENAATVVVNYTIGSGTSAKTTESTVTIPATTWASGSRYVYNLTITSKDIELILKVVDWDDQTGTANYGTGAIGNANALEFASGQASGSTRTSATFANATDPIKAYFAVFAPQGGTWKITVAGNTDKFTVTGPEGSTSATSNGTVTVTGSINGRVDFTVARNGASSSDSIEINFSVVTSDGRELNMNSEITRGGALTITG